MLVHSTRDVASAARGRRQDLRLSQAELAARAGVSRKWISEFEAGKTTAELGLAIKVLAHLGLSFDLCDTPKGRGSKRTVDLDALLAAHNQK